VVAGNARDPAGYARFRLVARSMRKPLHPRAPAQSFVVCEIPRLPFRAPAGMTLVSRLLYRRESIAVENGHSASSARSDYAGLLQPDHFSRYHFADRSDSFGEKLLRS
jgi:hypothetical protein